MMKTSYSWNYFVLESYDYSKQDVSFIKDVFNDKHFSIFQSVNQALSTPYKRNQKMWCLRIKGWFDELGFANISK